MVKERKADSREGNISVYMMIYLLAGNLMHLFFVNLNKDIPREENGHKNKKEYLYTQSQCLSVPEREKEFFKLNP